MISTLGSTLGSTVTHEIQTEDAEALRTATERYGDRP